VGTISPILVVTEIMFPLCFDRRYTFIPLRRSSTYTLDLDLHAGRPLPLRLPPSLGLSASALSRPYGHRPLVRQSFLFAFNQTSHTSMLLHGSVHGGGYQVKAKIRLIRESRSRQSLYTSWSAKCQTANDCKTHLFLFIYLSWTQAY
jgi:hypothetical protein